MRSINAKPNGSHEEQREISCNKKLKIHIKTKLPEKQQRRKRQIQSRPKELSILEDVGEEEEYNVDEELVLYSDMEEITAKSPEVSVSAQQQEYNKSLNFVFVAGTACIQIGGYHSATPAPTFSGRFLFH